MPVIDRSLSACRYVLRPGRGKQLVAIDGQDWVIEVLGGDYPCGGRAQMQFDVTMGKVQDAMISTLMVTQEMTADCPKKGKAVSFQWNES